MDKNKLASIRNRRLGFVFQSFNLLPQTSALENVMLPLLYDHHGSSSEADKREKALKALEAVGLLERVNHKPNELSGGQIQRVAIARALVNNPVLILADEPTGNLDTRASKEIMELLVDLHRKGGTIVMVTHSDEIADYAQRLVRFRDGRMESDTPNAIPFPQPIQVEIDYARR
jgi:putative ABC transport system ATP-binding protein